MPLARVTDEQIEQARKVSLLEHFQQTNPAVLKHIGGGRYEHKGHDSFVVDNGKGGWYWNSQSAGGLSYLDFLMRIEGMKFLDAVRYIVGDVGGTTQSSQKSREPPKSSPQSTPKPKPQKPFILPKPAIDNENMVSYLRKRGISESTIRKYISQGLLYESANSSCIFVGRDTQDGNNPKYAAERSITGDIKKDVAGSNKAFNFCLSPDNSENSNTIACFESPIDALSHKEIMKMAEVEHGAVKWDGHRLSLAGTASIALTSFLERNPHVQNIYLCLDGDAAGQKATERIVKELLSDTRFADKNIIIAPPPASAGKDYNEALQHIRRLVNERDLQRGSQQRQSLRPNNQQGQYGHSPLKHSQDKSVHPTRQKQAGFLYER